MKIKNNLNQNQTEMKPMGEKITKENYYLHPKLKRDLDGIASTMENIGDFGTEMGDRNYVFAGPPGTGKSLCVQYIGSQLDFPIYDGIRLPAG